MNTNLKLIKEWIEALRSGKYTQGQGCLRSIDDRFCCLGVLCDITNRKDWDEGEDSYYATILNEKDALPKSILNLLNLEDRTPDFKISSKNSKLLEILEENYEEEDRINYDDLTQLNDIWGLNFNQIADILEEEFLR